MEQIVFLSQGFLSRTLMTHRTAGEGRGQSFIPLYHFNPPTNIHTFILDLCSQDGYPMFLITLPGFTRLLLSAIYHLVELLFD